MGRGVKEGWWDGVRWGRLWEVGKEGWWDGVRWDRELSGLGWAGTAVQQRWRAGDERMS